MPHPARPESFACFYAATWISRVASNPPSPPPRPPLQMRFTFVSPLPFRSAFKASLHLRLSALRPIRVFIHPNCLLVCYHTLPDIPFEARVKHHLGRLALSGLTQRILYWEIIDITGPHNCHRGTDLPYYITGDRIASQ